MNISRKNFIESLAILSAGTMINPVKLFSNNDDLFFKISLAEWSLNRALFAGEITHMEFPEVAKKKFNIDAVEYVNQFFKDKAKDRTYLDELNQRCEDLGVNQLLIMVDNEGDLAVSSDKERKQAIENHFKWIEAANHLGCHSIRVNLFGNGSRKEQKMASVDSLGQLAEFATDYNINVLVENHGGYSSDGEWLADVMQQVDMNNCGTLPDFGNFCIKREGGARWEAPCVEKYDRYKGVRQLMPYAKGVSAKSYHFDKQGDETTIDFARMLEIVKESGFDGHIGIEYEGQEIPPPEGIKATKNLLTSLGTKLSS